MNTNKTNSTKTKSQKQPAAGEAESTIKAKIIQLGIDIHLDRYVVVRIIDGGTPQPPQRFEPAEFLLWVARQITMAEKVFTCYEAGPFGYSLHRKLEKMGATNYVVRPRDWDEYGKKVKTDKRGAKQLGLHLDRYVNGNHDTFCVVRVPSPRTRAGAQHLAAAGEFSARETTPGRTRTQPRPLLWRAPARRMVAGRSLEDFGSAVARDCCQPAGTLAPTDCRDASRTQNPDPGSGSWRAGALARRNG